MLLTFSNREFEAFRKMSLLFIQAVKGAGQSQKKLLKYCETPLYCQLYPYPYVMHGNSECYPCPPIPMVVYSIVSQSSCFHVSPLCRPVLPHYPPWTGPRRTIRLVWQHTGETFQLVFVLEYRHCTKSNKLIFPHLFYHQTT